MDGGARSLEIAPGAVRADSDALLHKTLGADGRSRVSMEDAAVALVDEAELPRFVQRRFTVGY